MENEVGGVCGTNGGRRELHARFFVGKREGKNQLGGLGLDVGIILQWTLKKFDRKAWTRFIWLHIRTRGGML
jgi:hypothetical protein